MSKPEEIPADVWSSAESALDDMLCNCIEASGTAEQFRIDSIVPIARALMAAKAEQRETDIRACAEYRQQYANHPPSAAKIASDNASMIISDNASMIIEMVIRKGGAA